VKLPGISEHLNVLARADPTLTQRFAEGSDHS
jgi:hypothetical protein